jgi:hypothetical protein
VVFLPCWRNPLCHWFFNGFSLNYHPAPMVRQAHHPERSRGIVRLMAGWLHPYFILRIRTSVFFESFRRATNLFGSVCP